MITQPLLQNKPNTYTFTKALAESLVFEECNETVPYCIVRPSIIGSAWKEPFEGWVDNFNGPSALFPAAGTGLLKSMLGDVNSNADIVPLDIVVNTLITAAWYRGSEKTLQNNVYHCTSGLVNRVSWGQINNIGIDCFFKNPFENLVMLPNPHFTRNNQTKFVRTLFEQLIPSYVLDFFLMIFLKKTMFVKIQNKIKKSLNVLEYFTMRSWEFKNENFLTLLAEMNGIDKKVT